MNPISRGIRQHSSVLHSVHRLLDAAVIAGVLFVALQATPVGGEAGNSLANELVIITAAAVLAMHVAAEATGLYHSWRGDRLRRELACIAMTWGYAVAGLLGIGLLTHYNVRFSYETKIAWLLGAPAAMMGVRVAIRGAQAALRSRGYNTRSVAICGTNELGVQLAENLNGCPSLGLRVGGFYDDRLAEVGRVAQNANSRTGDLDQLVADCRSGKVESVYITFPMRAEQRIRGVLSKLSDTTASVYIVPDFFVFELMHARWTNIDGLPAVSVHENPLHGVDGLFKRSCDLFFGSLLLALLAVPMALIAAAVKLTSRGPAIFRQKRYGLDGREIMVWKFRSMRTEDNGPVVRQATKHDSRITPLGAILRKTSLDELPQLFNVLQGTMSLVGPRPHATAHNEQYRTLIDGYMLRHKVKPGITGLAQVMGFRGETETLDKMQGRVRYDHLYIRDWSLWMDLKILFRTALVVLKQENAY
ncbi:UDP-glucose:undecaprenyl-phosphate glucose-1-phosphate transferase [Posidoniimonas polymericola]|uniref:UDP-glucose:undecaprenyl-phosphate glucose-1-phosphate transferase n=1 Tax=Posidoniimonas polymericola TaxID=2528002 RepID=A0A5C5YPK6_9BACT|nr:undecaprenyl-phosphate glucose phosphotransferase [Posidoniimonas polymericola]TWT76836.1 UDP-glucose:undecaprenyl-phosphate glucose-1-phosphate transferase [Posidoniimonas polymericola]